MRERGLLSVSTPQVLLDTMLFLSGLHFALRSGEEHRSLKLSQFELVSAADGCKSLIYTENYSKNNQGGLQHRKATPKTVTCYPIEKISERCLVRLYQVYLSHCPTGVESFYLTPLQKLKSDHRYSKVPVGHNTLSQTVGRLCKQAGIHGFKTNHSLRVTSATRLFQNGVDEQIIMSHTGHRSVDGVRCYKHVSEEQKKTVSGILNSASSGVQYLCNQPDPSKRMKLDVEQNCTSTCALTQVSSSSSTPTFNFSGCSFTINYNNKH